MDFFDSWWGRTICEIKLNYLSQYRAKQNSREKFQTAFCVANLHLLDSQQKTYIYIPAKSSILPNCTDKPQANIHMSSRKLWHSFMHCTFQSNPRLLRHSTPHTQRATKASSQEICKYVKHIFTNILVVTGLFRLTATNWTLLLPA